MSKENRKDTNRILEATAWALLFILWGVTLLFDVIPAGVGIAGTAVILLGLNGVRLLLGIPTRETTTVVGILALVWGGLLLAQPWLRLPFDLTGWAMLAILFVTYGIILLMRVFVRVLQRAGKGSQEQVS